MVDYLLCHHQAFWIIKPEVSLVLLHVFFNHVTCLTNVDSLTFEETSMKQTASNAACCLLHAGFLLGLLFSPYDGGDMLLQNAGLLSPGYMALYSRK
jgi:hypothetical protein